MQFQGEFFSAKKREIEKDKMSKHKIAVISDTHSLLRPEIIDKIKECELILHAGDIASKKTAEQLQSMTTTYFVRGNADKDNWAENIPVSRSLSLFGVNIFMIHNIKQMEAADNEKSGSKKLENQLESKAFDLVIYGHSHKYKEEYKLGVCYLNPGSCGPRRFHQDITMAILVIDEEAGSFSVDKVDCSPVLKTGSEKLPDRDMSTLVSKIIKQMDSGKTVSEIAKKNRVEEELVNQILQIYTTHQNIDVEGILNRLDIWGK